MYFIVNVTINRPNDLKALLLATTGGIILFYILGSLVSTNLLYIKEKILNSNEFLNIFNLFYMAFSFLFLILFLDTFTNLISNVRDDIFLIADSDGMYQRAGDFLTISFFIYSFTTAFFLFVNKYTKKGKLVNFMSFVLFGLYCLLTIGGMILSQMIGSNNTLVNLGGLLFATTIFYIFINFNYYFIRFFFIITKYCLKTFKKLFCIYIPMERVF